MIQFIVLEVRIFSIAVFFKFINFWEIVVVFPDAYRENNNECISFGNEKGKCVSFYACDCLKLKKDFNLSREMICGFEKDVPKLCCPTSDIIAAESSERDKIIASQSKLPECELK